MSLKRSASALVAQLSPPPPAKRLGLLSRSITDMTPEEWDDFGVDYDNIVKTMDSLPKPKPRPDERQAITDELESGTCVVQAECKQQYDERIIGPYRINLNATKPSSRHWSEAIGVDVRKHLAKTFIGDYIRYERPVDANSLAAAIKDWIFLGGKAYDASLYSNKAYQIALSYYRHDNAASGCGQFERAPVVPNNSDYTDVQPAERKLSDVVLQSLGAGHLVGKVPMEVLIVILDVAGSVPPSMTKAAWDAAEAVQEGGQGAIAVEDDHDAGIESIPVPDNPSAAGTPALDGGSVAEPVRISDQGEVLA
ncbi:hypothetical protein LTR17_018935 [Elasticomyces elasticus]|nr:hypothetical protein LTR17_018935 [Elasticomyces elasticus]